MASGVDLPAAADKVLRLYELDPSSVLICDMLIAPDDCNAMGININ
jgi:hypothetical protein